MRGHRILAIAIVAAVVIGLVVAGDSEGGLADEPEVTAVADDLAARQELTNWQPFGNGAAWSRLYTSLDYAAMVFLQSVTKEDPQEVRYLIRGRPFTTVDIDYALDCSGGSMPALYLADTIQVTSPYVHRFTVVGYEICTLFVGAHRWDEGRLVVKFQAKYRTTAP